MRFLKYALVTMCCIVAVSCFEVNEEITISEDGSGVYNSKLDMSQMLELMQSFAGEEELKKEGLDRVIDTTIMFGHFLDSADGLTNEQKALMKDGKMDLQMNFKEKIFKINMNFPYKNQNSLQQLLQSGGAGSNTLGKIFGEVFKKPGDSTVPQASSDPGMGDISTIYDVTVKNGLISRKVNEEKANALLQKPEMAQLKQMGSSGMEILYSTTIRLPRPVKNVDNPAFKVSDDKKTVTLKYNLLELIENPSKFSYTIEY